MKRVFTLCCMLLSISMTTTLLAVPAKPGIHTIEQADGTTLRIEMHGDEHFHFTTTEDGYLIRQNAHGVYEYAELTAEKVVKPIGVKAYSIDQRATAAQQLPSRAVKATQALRDNQLIKEKKLHVQAISPRKKEATTTAALPSRGLVLLVQYSDVKFYNASTQTSMSNMLNGSNYDYEGATGSVRKYFTDQSNGKYVPDFDVIGPITLSRKMAYYGGNDSYGNDLRPHEMVNEACSIANARFGADFSRYDSDNDGWVDFVYVIYAGYAEAQGADENTIWPHSSSVSSDDKYDGKYVGRYACSSELRGYSGTTRDGIGTFCHEFSHVLGLPDYYDTDYADGVDNTANIPGVWSLMSGGSYNNDSKTPPNYSSYDKYYLGWVTPTLLNTTGSVTLRADGLTYYAITADGILSSATMPKDVWYLENRQQTGWDAYLPTSGMLVTKVHYDQAMWDWNSVNNGTPMRYDIIEADGLSSAYRDAHVTFPGVNNVRTFSPVGNYTLTNISESSGVVTFNLGVEPYDDTLADNVVFYDGFEDPENWITSDPSTTSALVEYGGICVNRFTDISAAGGDYYLISSYDESAVRNAWAISTNNASLQAGHEYTLSAYVWAPGSTDVADQIQFTIGRSSDISSHTKVVFDVHEKYGRWTLISAKFTPTLAGVYHFGIHHCTQEVNLNYVMIDELTVTASASEPQESTDEKLFYDSFESYDEWIMTDPSSTCMYAEYGGIFLASFDNLPAPGGNYYLISSYDASASRDAWAIMRNGVSLEAGEEYTISAYIYAPGYDGVADQIQFTVGTSSAISSQRKVILDVYEQYDSWTLVTTTFTPTSNGIYHFGIHHCTQTLDVNAIAIDEFTITHFTVKEDTALEDIEIHTSSAQKVLENGIIYILRKGEKYTIDGRKVE